jgi:tRNA-Thr(GGU) m(6)t(6)A37 methyltransferase TsaA
MIADAARRSVDWSCVALPPIGRGAKSGADGFARAARHHRSDAGDDENVGRHHLFGDPDRVRPINDREPEGRAEAGLSAAGVEAWVEVAPEVADGLLGVEAGQEVVLITWLHESVRDVLQVYPRWKEDLPLTGVFLTRSPDRPNPLGLHRVTILEVDGERLRVVPLEVIDGTPVVDIKAVMSEVADW